MKKNKYKKNELVKAKNRVIYIFIFLLLFSCKGNKQRELRTENNNWKNMDELVNEEIKNHFKKYENLTEDEDIEITEDDIKWEIPIVYNGLKKMGYHFVSDTLFYDRVKKIFGFTPQTGDIAFVKHQDFFTYVFSQSSYDDVNERRESILLNEYFLPENIFFVKKYNFIMPLPSYEFFGKIENGGLVVHQDGMEIDFPKQYLFHRNNYLFHDNQQSLTWLIQNDLDFLEILVREFGYDKNGRLNKAVLKNIYKQYSEDHNNKEYLQERRFKILKNLFFKRDCYGKLQIRDGLMNTISEMTDKENTEYLDWMTELITMIRIELSDRDKYEIFASFDKQDFLKLLAYIDYYEELTFIKKDFRQRDAKGNDRASLMYDLRDISQLLPFLKENDFFNLPGFPEMVQEKWDYLDKEQRGIY